jgi:hypothetical protein
MGTCLLEYWLCDLECVSCEGCEEEGGVLPYRDMMVIENWGVSVRNVVASVTVKW